MDSSLRAGSLPIVWLALALAACALNGCGGGDSFKAEAAPGLSPAARSFGDSILPLPNELIPLLDVPRRSSYVETDLIRHGKDFEAGYPHQKVGASSNNAKFSTDWSEANGYLATSLGYAIYEFAVAGYDRSPEVRYGWSDPPDEIATAWLGLGNQDTNAWDWFPCNDLGLNTVPAFDPYISSLDTLLVVFVLANAEVSSLRYVRLGPHTLAAQLFATSQGIVPFTAAYNAGASTTAVGTLDLFEWDFDGDGTYDADTGATASTSSNITDTGVYHPVVRVTSSYGVSDTASDTITAVNAWTTTWGRTYTDQLNALQLDSEGNIYAVGQSGDPDASTAQLLLLKFAPSGEPLWARSWAAASVARGDSGSYGTGIRQAGDSDLLVMGASQDPSSGALRLLLQKWTTAGELLWSKAWGGSTQTNAIGEVLLPVADALYVVGFTDAFSTEPDVALFKLSADGEIDWLKTYGGADVEFARDAAVTGLLMPTGIAVAGSTRSFGALDSDILLVNFDLAGSVTLEQRWHMASIQFANALYLEPAGEQYLAGYTLNTADDADVLLLGVNSLGTEISKETWGTTGYDRALNLRRAGGATYICGEGYKSPGDSFYALLLQLDSSGDEVAAQTWQAAGDAFDNFARLYFYAGGQLLCGQADDAGGSWMGISGAVDKSPAGSWQPVSGTVTDQVASMSVAEGTVTDLTDGGVLNTGAGKADALLMLTEMP
jgi:hypothetical protein